MQSASIIVVDQAQQELASSLKRVINDHVTSIATTMASQFQANVDRAGNSVDLVDPMTPLDDGLPNIGIGDGAPALPVDPMTPLDDGLPNIGIGDGASALPVDPMTPLDDGLPTIGIGDGASTSPYPFLFSCLDAIDAKKVLASAARILSDIKMRQKQVPASAACILSDIKMRQRGLLHTLARICSIYS
jgi:hypothetical protein